MANYSYITSKKLNLANCLQSLRVINKDVFEGKFAISSTESSILLQHSDDKTLRIEFHLQDFTLKWKTYVRLEQSWFTETIAAKLIRTINPNLKIHNEGVEETITPTFDQEYPTLEDWLREFSIPIQ